MSRGKQQHQTSWVTAAASNDFRASIDAQLEQAIAIKPSGRLDLSAQLGYPDFEPSTADKDEEKLTSRRLREGFCDTSFNLYNPQMPSGDEHGSMEEKFGSQDLEEIRKKLGLPKKQLRRPKRIRPKCTLFPEPEYSGSNYLDQWLKDLAACQQPLAALARQVPYIPSTAGYPSRGREVLNRLTDLQVPMLRATWFVKVTLLKEQMDRSSTFTNDNVDPQIDSKLCDAWTEVLTNFMHEHFLSFANARGRCETGSQVERLVRKWAYVVRLADWCYHEGILSRQKYITWVINAFQNTVQDPQHNASWSAELILPLVANFFPDLCRLRTEIPDLIRVCVSRYMREIVQLPGTALGPPAGSTMAWVIPSANPALSANLRKLVQSLLVVCPDAFASLAPETQAAWRLIEQDPNVKDISSIKEALRNEHANAVPSSWLHVAMPWVECERRMKGFWDDNSNFGRQPLIEGLDKCCTGRCPCDVNRLKEQFLKCFQTFSPWQHLFDDHSRARTYVSVVCGWATNHHRQHVPEAQHVAVSFLKDLGASLLDIVKHEESPDMVLPTGEERGAASCSASIMSTNDSPILLPQVQPQAQKLNESAAQGEARTQPDYALQSYLEDVLETFTPEPGSEEIEISNLEKLFGELIHARIFNHDRWVHNLLSKGIFEGWRLTEKADPSIQKYHRLLANLPWFSDAPYDICQRSILLKSINALDLGFTAPYYALKINRFLFWSVADLDPTSLRATPGSEIFERFDMHPDLKAVGKFNEERICEIEWEESVHLAWLQNESHHEFSDHFTNGILASRGQAVLWASLSKIIEEAPHFVRTQLTRHTCAVVQYVLKGREQVSELDLIDTMGVSESIGLSDEVLYRAVTLLECAGDLLGLVNLLQWIMIKSPCASVAVTLLANLRAVRATDMTAQVFSTCVSALARVEAAGMPSIHTGTAIRELLCAMVRYASESSLKTFEDIVKGVPAGDMMQAVLVAVNAAREGTQVERDLDLRGGTDDHELEEAIKTGGLRPELTEAVGQVINTNASFDSIADGVIKRMNETGCGHGVLVSTVLRAAVNGILKEIKANYRFGYTGFAISACASLLAALDRKLKPRLPRILLHIVMERMYEPAVVPAASEDTSPSTVDTPQPQTDLSPATPDSLPTSHAGKNAADANDNGLRQDATLAFVGVLLARGLLSWEDVETAVKAKLECVVKHPKNTAPSKLLFNFVHLLLTDKRKGTAAMIPNLDWQKLRILRLTQPTLSDVYLMVKHLVLVGVGDECWKLPAIACIDQVVHDEGFCRIASCDDPRSFFKECPHPCMTLLNISDAESPFRSFSFIPKSSTKKGAIAGLQDVLARSSRWTLHYDCTELRILVDSWKLGDNDEGEKVTDGWQLWKKNTAVDQEKLEVFESHLSEDSKKVLCESLQRHSDRVIEHHVVDVLLARLWRQPIDCALTVDFAKSMGAFFIKDGSPDKDGTGWFEWQMLKTILAVMTCEPVAKACMGVHTFFEHFVHTTALPSGHVVDPETAASPAHREAFEQALVQFVGSYGPLPSQGQNVEREAAVFEGSVRMRMEFLTTVVQLTTGLVDMAEKGEFEWMKGRGSWGTGLSEGQSLRPSLGNLQRGVVLRLRILSAGLETLWDDGQQIRANETQALLQSTIELIGKVCSCEALFSDGTGEMLYKTVTILVQRVGFRSVQIRVHPPGPGGQANVQIAPNKRVIWEFKQQVQQELLRCKVPHFLDAHSAQDLPLRNISVPTGGHVSAPAAEASSSEGHANAQSGQAGGAASRPATFEGNFDVGPWLLLEDFPGVISSRLAHAKKRPRMALAYEYVSPEAAAAYLARVQASTVVEDPPPDPEVPHLVEDEDVMQLDYQLAGAPAGDGGWGGWNDAADGSFFGELDLQ